MTKTIIAKATIEMLGIRFTCKCGQKINEGISDLDDFIQCPKCEKEYFVVGITRHSISSLDETFDVDMEED